MTLPADEGPNATEAANSRYAFKRRRLELLHSLEAPHASSQTTAALGMGDWLKALPPGDEELLDPAAGVLLRWMPEQGWQEPEA